MKTTRAITCLGFAFLLSACGSAPPSPTATRALTPTRPPPTSTPTATRTPLPSDTPIPPTPTPQTILLRGSCGTNHIVGAEKPLQIYYGGWGVLGMDLADQWSASLVVDLEIDGEPVTGELQRPAHELPYNCRESGEDIYWLYYTTILPGLSTAPHQVTVTFNSLRALSDGGGTMFGPGRFIQESFTISGRPSAGLTLTRSEAAYVLGLLGFAFQPPTTVSGPEEMTGASSDGMAVIHLLGPEEALTSVSVVIDVPAPPTEEQFAASLVYLSAVLGVAGEGWPEGPEWLNAALSTWGETRTTFDGLEAILVTQERVGSAHIEFTISVAP